MMRRCLMSLCLLAGCATQAQLGGESAPSRVQPSIIASDEACATQTTDASRPVQPRHAEGNRDVDQGVHVGVSFGQLVGSAIGLAILSLVAYPVQRRLRLARQAAT